MENGKRWTEEAVEVDVDLQVQVRAPLASLVSPVSIAELP